MASLLFSVSLNNCQTGEFFIESTHEVTQPDLMPCHCECIGCVYITSSIVTPDWGRGKGCHTRLREGKRGVTCTSYCDTPDSGVGKGVSHINQCHTGLRESKRGITHQTLSHQPKGWKKGYHIKYCHTSLMEGKGYHIKHCPTSLYYKSLYYK